MITLQNYNTDQNNVVAISVLIYIAIMSLLFLSVLVFKIYTIHDTMRTETSRNVIY